MAEFIKSSTVILKDEKGRETGRKVYPSVFISGEGMGMKVCLSALPENKGHFWDTEGKTIIDPDSLDATVWGEIRKMPKTGPCSRETFGIKLPEEIEEEKVLAVKREEERLAEAKKLIEADAKKKATKLKEVKDG